MMRFGLSRALLLLALPAVTRGLNGALKPEQLQPGQLGALSSPNSPFCIGVAGATASGKSSVVAEVVRLLDAEGRVASVTQDCFYKDLSEAEREAAYNSNHNFDRARRSVIFFKRGSERSPADPSLPLSLLGACRSQRLRLAAAAGCHDAAATGHQARRRAHVRFRHPVRSAVTHPHTRARAPPRAMPAP